MDQIAAFKQRCVDADLSPVDVLTRAGLHRATWFRWSNGTSLPNLRSLKKAEEALEQMKGERQPAA